MAKQTEIESGQVRSDFSGRLWVVQEQVTGEGLAQDGKWWIYNVIQRCRRKITPLTLMGYKLEREGLPLDKILAMGKD